MKGARGADTRGGRKRRREETLMKLRPKYVSLSLPTNFRSRFLMNSRELRCAVVHETRASLSEARQGELRCREW